MHTSVRPPSSAHHSHRVCAVFGGTYVLGRKIDDVALDDGAEGEQVVRIDIGEDRLTAGRLITAMPTSTGSPLHRGIVVLDRPIYLNVPVASSTAEPTESETATTPNDKQAESALFVFPQDTFPGQDAAVHALMLGESAFACPEGQRAFSLVFRAHILSDLADVLYLSTLNSSASGEATLRPALDALLVSTPETRVLFELFYTDAPIAPPSTLSSMAAPHLVPLRAPAADNLAELPSASIAEAHRLFKLLVPSPQSDELFAPSASAADDDG